jgi:hypothetical protein
MLTCTWVKGPTGKLAMKWAKAEDPAIKPTTWRPTEHSAYA